MPLKRSDKPIRYHAHAWQRMMERGVSRELIESVVERPDTSRPARRPGAKRWEKRFSKQRRLAIIAEESATEIWVITAFWM
jgi:hypothetical protein